jgi:serine protein kinase
MKLFQQFSDSYQATKQETMSLEDYLELCKTNKLVYATAAERMLDAIGEPTVVDTSEDPKLSRIFMNRTIKVYPAFKDFYGMEDTIERIVGYFRHSAQGLEEKKQVLYLLGPVGSAKSSLAEKLKELMEKHPIYTLAIENPETNEFEISPIFESPLGLFNPAQLGETLQDDYGIDLRYLTGIASPWAIKRLDQVGGDLSKFKVVKLQPSKLRQIGVMKTEPGDENNQDISSLVGKVDIRKLEYFSQNDPDAYSFSGSLNRTTQGMMEFVEMFKAPLKTLHPLLTATQEGNYVGTESISAIPFNGIILAHSNETEWKAFKNNKNNEAFLDRICIIKVPYCNRIDEETKIYQKMINSSSLSVSPCAPETLKMLAEFIIQTRIKKHENSNLFSKMRIYNGENIKDLDPHAKSLQEYRDLAGVDEGMTGVSTRFAFKILSKTYNFDPHEVAADPIHLMYVLEKELEREQFDKETEQFYLSLVKEGGRRYAEYLGKEIHRAYLESYSSYGQNIFEKYVDYADSYISDQEFKDPDTGLLLNKTALSEELEKIEKPVGVANPKDFRSEVVNFCLRYKASHNGKMPSWTSYEKMRAVIEKRMFSNLEEILPVISFDSKKDKELEKKHHEFVQRMKKNGYTEKQVRRLCEWYSRSLKS